MRARHEDLRLRRRRTYSMGMLRGHAEHTTERDRGIGDASGAPSPSVACARESRLEAGVSGHLWPQTPKKALLSKNSRKYLKSQHHSDYASCGYLFMGMYIEHFDAKRSQK